MIMEWFETESRRQIAETAGRFAQKELLARHREAGEAGEPGMPPQAVREAGSMGLLAGPLPEELGGVGMDAVSETILWEKISEGLAGAAALMAFHSAGLGVLADLREAPSVRAWLEEAFLEGSGEEPALVSLAVPEPVVDCGQPSAPRLESGTEAGEERLLGGFLCLPGLSAGGRLLALIPAGPGEAAVGWLDPRDAETLFTLSRPGSGLEELRPGRLAFSGPLPRGMEILCRGDEASGLVRQALIRLRISLAAIQTGNAEAAWLEARDYASQRVQTGRVITEHQEVRRMLVNMETRVQACRSFVYRAAALTEDASVPGEAEVMAGQVFRFCGEAAEAVCLDAVQVMGGYGYMKDYGVEKRLRDCKSLQAILGSHPVDWLGGS